MRDWASSAYSCAVIPPLSVSCLRILSTDSNFWDLDSNELRKLSRMTESLSLEEWNWVRGGLLSPRSDTSSGGKADWGRESDVRIGLWSVGMLRLRRVDGRAKTSHFSTR